VTDQTAAIEVWARMLCAADVHVHGEDHPTWQQLVGEPGSKIRDDYRKAAAWLLPRMTVATDRAAGVADAIRAFPFDNFGMDDVTFALEDDPEAQEWVPALADAILATLPETTAQAVKLRDYWHAEAMSATSRIIELEGQLEELRRVAIATTDRAAVLLWAADQIDAETRQAKADEVLEPDKYRPCRDASAQLRRMAAEAGPADTVGQDGEAWNVPDARPGTTDHTLTQPEAQPAVEAQQPICKCPAEICQCGHHQAQPSKEAENPRTVCVCGHTRGEHATVGGPFGRGRLLCAECTDVCKEFEAL
jgi:hypothetical protein